MDTTKYISAEKACEISRTNFDESNLSLLDGKAHICSEPSPPYILVKTNSFLSMQLLKSSTMIVNEKEKTVSLDIIKYIKYKYNMEIEYKHNINITCKLVR